jgi:hypothetical protein
MSQQELLRRVVEALDRAGIDYMLTGSFASSLQGEPRSTHDLDLVIAVDSSKLQTLFGAFPPPAYYLDLDSAREAIGSGGMFNLIEVEEGDKVDFWMLTDEPFDRSRFARKYAEEVFGVRLKVSAPEDTILQKLHWSNLSGGSEKAFTDALRVYEVQSDGLDLDYIHSWLEPLGVQALWTRLRREAGES